jgi:hypothetical protein
VVATSQPRNCRPGWVIIENGAIRANRMTPVEFAMPPRDATIAKLAARWTPR